MELKYGNITITVSGDDADECREAYLAFGELCGFKPSSNVTNVVNIPSAEETKTLPEDDGKPFQMRDVVQLSGGNLKSGPAWFYTSTYYVVQGISWCLQYPDGGFTDRRNQNIHLYPGNGPSEIVSVPADLFTLVRHRDSR